MLIQIIKHTETHQVFPDNLTLRIDLTRGRFELNCTDQDQNYKVILFGEIKEVEQLNMQRTTRVRL